MDSPSGTATATPPSPPPAAVGGSIHWLAEAPADPSSDVDAAWAMAMAARYARTQDPPFPSPLPAHSSTVCSRCALPRKVPPAACLRTGDGTQGFQTVASTARPDLHAFLSDPDAFGCKATGAAVIAGRASPEALTVSPWLQCAPRLRTVSAHSCACWRCSGSGAAGSNWRAAPEEEKSPSQRSILCPAALAYHHHHHHRYSVAAAHATEATALSPGALQLPELSLPLPPAAGNRARCAGVLASAREAHPSTCGPPVLGEHWDDGSGDAKIETVDKANSENTELKDENTLLEQRANINNPGLEFEHQKEHLLVAQCEVVTETLESDPNFKLVEGEEREEKVNKKKQSSETMHEHVHTEDTISENMTADVSDRDIQGRTEKNDVEDSHNKGNGEIGVVDVATQCEAQSKDELSSTKNKYRKSSNNLRSSLETSSSSSTISSSGNSSGSSMSSESSGSSSTSDSSDATSATQSSTWVSGKMERVEDLSECLWCYWTQNLRPRQRRASGVDAVGMETASMATPEEVTEELSQSSSSSSSVDHPKLLAPPSTPCERFRATNPPDTCSVPMGCASRSGIKSRLSLHISIPGISPHKQSSPSRSGAPPASKENAPAPGRAGRRAGARVLPKGTDRTAGVTTANSFNKGVTLRRLVAGGRISPVAGASRTVPPTSNSMGFTVGQMNVAAAVNKAGMSGDVVAGRAGGNLARWQRGPPRCAGDRAMWSHRPHNTADCTSAR